MMYPNQQTDADAAKQHTMMLTVVLSIAAEDGPQVFSNACAALEDCCTLTKTEWKVDEGVAIFVGIASHPLSYCTAKLYACGDTKMRVRGISYHGVRTESK